MTATEFANKSDSTSLSVEGISISNFKHSERFIAYTYSTRTFP